MNHSKRSFNNRRPERSVKAVRRVILFVEGENTEKSYFDLLKKTCCKIIPVTKRGHGISSCVDFVNESEKAWCSMPKKEREKYEQRWLVFDADGHEDFDPGVKLARKKGFEVAFSNMCIEYWFMLHFYNHDGSVIPLRGDSHSAAQIKYINDFITSYNKKAGSPIPIYDSGSKMVEEDFFDLMLAIDQVTHKSRVVSAYERAKAIHESKIRNGCETSESVTTIYTLLEQLGVIEKNGDTYMLHRN